MPPVSDDVGEAFALLTTVGTGATPVALGLGDFNQDGKTDVAVVNQGSNTFSLLLNPTPFFPIPLYTSYEDVWRVVQALKTVIDTGAHLRVEEGRELVA